MARPPNGEVWHTKAICGYCGKEHIRPFNRLKSKRHFCSKGCYDKSQMTNNPIKCLVCGVEFYCSKSQQKYRNRKCCSMKCQIEYKRINRIGYGKECPFWKGGVSDENRKVRYSARMETWRKSVFERDNYTCQECGIRGSYIEAHHIKPFAEFKELRFDISNGTTLCRKCHDKTKKGAPRKYTNIISQKFATQEDNDAIL